MNLVKFCGANSNKLKSLVSLICSLNFNSRINFPLNSNPKLLIPLIYLLLQPCVLLLQFPVLQPHGLHPILLIDVVHELLRQHHFENFALKEAPCRRLQANCCIIFYRQLLILDKNGQSRLHIRLTVRAVLELTWPTLAHVRCYYKVSQLGIKLLKHIICALPAIIELLLEISLVVLLNDGFFVTEIVIFVCKYLRGMTIDILYGLPQIRAVRPHEHPALVLLRWRDQIRSVRRRYILNFHY